MRPPFAAAPPEDLVAIKLAVLEEAAPSAELPEGKYRLIGDASFSHTNNRVRVPNQVEYPGCPEVEAVIATPPLRRARGSASGEPTGSLNFCRSSLSTW